MSPRLDLHSQRDVLRSLPVAGGDHNLLVGVTGTSKRAGSAQGFPIPPSVQSPPQRQAPEVTLLMLGYSTLRPTGPNSTSPALLPQNTLTSFPLCSQNRGHAQCSPIPVPCVQQQPEIPRGQERSRDIYFIAFKYSPPSQSLQLRDI